MTITLKDITIHPVVEQLFGQIGEKSHHVEKRPLLLDNGVNGDVVERNRHGHWRTFCGRRCGDVSRLVRARKRQRCNRHLYRTPHFFILEERL